MILLYNLLRETPREISDPDTKERYGCLPVHLHVLGEVMTAVIELLMAVVTLLVAFDGVIQAELEDCLLGCLAAGLLVMVPGICLLLVGLIYSGLLKEVR